MAPKGILWSRSMRTAARLTAAKASDTIFRKQTRPRRPGFLLEWLCDKIHKVRQSEYANHLADKQLWITDCCRFCSSSAFRRPWPSACSLAGSLIGPRRQSAVKQMPYESGMDPIHDAHRKFDVRFYLVAIAFLVFDVELLFLYPWAVASRDAAAASTRPWRAAGRRHWPDAGAGFWRSAGLYRACWRRASSMPGGRGCSRWR